MLRFIDPTDPRLDSGGLLPPYGVDFAKTALVAGRSAILQEASWLRWRIARRWKSSRFPYDWWIAAVIDRFGNQSVAVTNWDHHREGGYGGYVVQLARPHGPHSGSRVRVGNVPDSAVGTGRQGHRLFVPSGIRSDELNVSSCGSKADVRPAMLVAACAGIRMECWFDCRAMIVCNHL